MIKHGIVLHTVTGAPASHAACLITWYLLAVIIRHNLSHMLNHALPLENHLLGASYEHGSRSTTPATRAAHWSMSRPRPVRRKRKPDTFQLNIVRDVGAPQSKQSGDAVRIERVSVTLPGTCTSRVNGDHSSSDPQVLSGMKDPINDCESGPYDELVGGLDNCGKLHADCP